MGDGVEFSSHTVMTLPKTPESARRRVHLRYARPHALYMRGPLTGEPYVFNPGVGTPVDVGDAAALIDTGLFEGA